MDFNARREFTLQAFDDISIEFNYRKPVDARKQRPRQRAQAWTNFDQYVVALRRNRFDDRRNDGGIDEKVLAEPLAGNVAHVT